MQRIKSFQSNEETRLKSEVITVEADELNQSTKIAQEAVVINKEQLIYYFEPSNFVIKTEKKSKTPS